ncbi:MAG: DUF4340 domain-containing protein [Spirochaetia bacterium]
MQFRIKLISLSSVLAVLVLTFVLGIAFSPEATRSAFQQREMFPNVEQDAVNTVTITGGEEGIHVSRADEQWAITVDENPFPAKTTAVETFIDELLSLDRFRVVSRNSETWEQFEVTEEAATHIQVFDSADQALIDIYVGKEGNEGRGNYMRIAGSDTVYLAVGSFTYYLDRDQGYWSNLKIMPPVYTGNDVTSISVTADIDLAEPLDAQYMFIRQENGWVLEGNPDFTVRESRLNNLANTSVGIEADAFVANTDPEITGLDNPSGSVEITLDDNSTYAILFGNRTDDDHFYVMREDGNYVYRMSMWKTMQLLRPLSEYEPLESEEDTSETEETAVEIE